MCSDWELRSKDLSTGLGASNRESGFPKLDARGSFGDLPLLKDWPPLPAHSPGNTHTHTHRYICICMYVYIYIYIYILYTCNICICLYMYVYIYIYIIIIIYKYVNI